MTELLFRCQQKLIINLMGHPVYLSRRVGQQRQLTDMSNQQNYPLYLIISYHCLTLFIQKLCRAAQVLRLRKRLLGREVVLRQRRRLRQELRR